MSMYTHRCIAGRREKSRAMRPGVAHEKEMGEYTRDEKKQRLDRRTRKSEKPHHLCVEIVRNQGAVKTVVNVLPRRKGEIHDIRTNQCMRATVSEDV